LASGIEGTQRLLLTCSSDTTIAVRHGESGLLVRTLTGHQQPILCMTVHNNLVYSGGQDKTVQVHNYHTGKIIHVIHGHKGFVTGIHCFGDNIITASADQHVRCYSSKACYL
jgi:WD40 repeat protein